MIVIKLLMARLSRKVGVGMGIGHARCVCVCSVVKREPGFEDFRFIAEASASSLGFKVIRNPERDGMTQEEFERMIREESPIVLYIVGTVRTEVTTREVRLALEHGCDVHVFCLHASDEGFHTALEHVREISAPLANYGCVAFASCEELYRQVGEKLKLSQEGARCGITIFKRNQTYRMCKDVVAAAKLRVVLVQNTSTLMIGTERVTESSFYATLRDWLGGASPSASFIHVFSSDSTDKELRKRGVNRRARLATLRDEVNACRAACKIGCVREPVSPFLLTDRDIAGEMRFGSDVYCFRAPLSVFAAQRLSIVEDLIESGAYVSLYDSESGIDKLSSAYNVE